MLRKQLSQLELLPYKGTSFPPPEHKHSHIGVRCTLSAALKVGFLGTSIGPHKSALVNSALSQLEVPQGLDEVRTSHQSGLSSIIMQ